MDTILFNAFSFLQKKLKEKNIDCTNAKLPIAKGETVKELLCRVKLEADDIEGAFVNGKIVSPDTILTNGDRVAVFPPGTPGPYRLLLGIVKNPVKR